ncbi:MAG: Phosphoesterase PA-phosphatase related protein, partial [Frankiales bacterium]|nr:Phosphoesterase PA-phosphatase related protein [Frankiales bacterium]
MLTRLSSWDKRAFSAAHRVESPALDRVLPRLTASADHGGLWCAVAAGLAVTGRRRSAVRGLASLGVASAVANGPAKLLARRAR